jgi:hypothetical protein
MNQQLCPGLLAEIPHQWLAAVGATVIAEELRLSWTDDPSPCAVLHSPHKTPGEVLHAAWPSRDDFAQIPIVEWNLNNKQDIPLTEFRRMANAGLSEDHAWSLAAAATDLARSNRATKTAERGPFNPGFQGPSSPHRSLVKMVACTAADIAQSLEGILPSAKGDGLGLDPDRFPDPQGTGTGVKTIHPIEIMAFFGLALFPLRGDGTVDASQARQRGWTIRRGSGDIFRWPAWRKPLDRWAIDALLDAWNPDRRPVDEALGVTAAWRSLRVDRPGKNPGRGYTSERLP